MWAKVVISFLEIAYPLRRHKAAVLRVDSQRNGLLSGNLRRTFPARHGPVTGKVFAVGFDLDLAAIIEILCPLRRHQAVVLRVDSQRNGLLSGNLRRTFPARHGPVTGKVFAVGFDPELAARS